MIDIKQQRQWEEERREKDRIWQEQRRREDEACRKQDLEWQVSQAKLAAERWDKEHRLQRNSLVIVGIVGTFVLATATIVAAIISAAFSK